MAINTSDRTSWPQSWIANAATVLVVTILAGVVVWWLTGPPSSNASANYSLTSTGSFFSPNSGKFFYTLDLENPSTMAANDITLALQAPPSANIEDLSITTSATHPKIGSVNRDSNRISLSIPSLRPDEIIRVSISYRSASQPDVKVVAVSSNALIHARKSKGLEFVRDKPWLLVILFISYAVASYYISRFVRQALYRKMNDFGFYLKNANNSAFILIHAGDWPEAKQILESTLRQGKGGAYELSNYAVTLAQSGKIETALAIVKTLKLWTNDNTHLKDVIIFNEYIINRINGENVVSKEFDSLLNKNPELKKYYERSKLFA